MRGEIWKLERRWDRRRAGEKTEGRRERSKGEERELVFWAGVGYPSVKGTAAWRSSCSLD